VLPWSPNQLREGSRRDNKSNRAVARLGRQPVQIPEHSPAGAKQEQSDRSADLHASEHHALRASHARSVSTKGDKAWLLLSKHVLTRRPNFARFPVHRESGWSAGRVVRPHGGDWVWLHPRCFAA
jgi:hypothetical protein